MHEGSFSSTSSPTRVAFCLSENSHLDRCLDRVPEGCSSAAREGPVCVCSPALGWRWESTKARDNAMVMPTCLPHPRSQGLLQLPSSLASARQRDPAVIAHPPLLSRAQVEVTFYGRSYILWCIECNFYSCCRSYIGSSVMWSTSSFISVEFLNWPSPFWSTVLG